MKKMGLTAIIAIFVLVIGIGTASANLVTNGGFETGDFTGWTQWGEASPFNHVVPDPYYVHDGSYGGQFGPYDYSGIEQTLTTTPGQEYNLSFWLNNDGFFPGNAYQIYWNGTSIDYLEHLSLTDWVQKSFNLYAIGTSTVLRFEFYNVPGFWGLDTIDVSPTQGVPEPASLLLLGFGLVGLVGFRRRVKN